MNRYHQLPGPTAAEIAYADRFQAEADKLGALPLLEDMAANDEGYEYDVRTLTLALELNLLREG
jgi:hypothetical protein